MARIFISYAREDKGAVAPLAEGLKHAGHDVWWDANLGASEVFRQTIETQLAVAEVVVVVWSRLAGVSRYVADEAERAVSRGVLLPLRLDDSPPPLGFGSFNALDFRGWSGEFDCVEWRRLLAEVRRIALAPSPSRPHRSPRILRHALVVASVSGIILGHLLWGLYSFGPGKAVANMLGHPLIDAIALGLAAATPVAVVSAIETARAGFEKLSLIARRALSWYAWSSGIGLIVIALSAAMGTLDISSPRSTAAELGRAFVIVVAAAAFALSVMRLGLLTYRHFLSRRPR